MSCMHILGIDLGSTTVKYVLTDLNGNIIAKDYKRHQSAVLKTLIEMLNDIDVSDSYIYFTGSASLALTEKLNLPFLQEVVCANIFLKSLETQCDVAIELGGEDSKIIFLTDGSELRMNEACAGGTGAFIDQCATLLNVDAKTLNDLAKDHKNVHPIASRCGVFAKTDIVSLLNSGVSVNDIAKSIFDAVAEQTISGLALGREIKGNVACLGGPLSFLSELYNSFKEKLNKNTFIKIKDSQTAIAYGACLYVKQKLKDNLNEKIINLKNLIAQLQNTTLDFNQDRLKPLFNNETELAEFKAFHKQHKVNNIGFANGHGNLYLGVDLGSTTVKCALINEESEIVDSYYTNNEGEPLKKLIPYIKSILPKLNSDAKIRSICTTGYGADLAKCALNAQFSEVETLAHQKGASSFDAKTSYVIDIGGQDMKCIKVQDGVIKAITLNEACSSGCGSFIETFSKQLNLTVPEFVAKALSAKHPCDLGIRCTVFMNSKVKQAQRDNVAIEDIAAGLCLSIVRNALYKVLKIHDVSELGDHVVVQGGTFLNDAVLRSFEVLINKKVIRPNIAGLMGAYGAALIAKERTTSDTKELNLSEENLDLSEVVTRNYRCRGCNNHCLLTMNTFKNGQKHIQGNRCDFSLKNLKKGNIESFIDFKNELLFNRKVIEDDKALGTIAIPRVLNIFEHFPF